MSGIKNIGDDHGFIDKLFAYYQTKKESKKSSDNEENIQYSLLQVLVDQYLEIVVHCLECISSETEGSPSQKVYRDWLRWNKDVVVAELDEYKVALKATTCETKIGSQHIEVEALCLGIDNCKDYVNATCCKYFTLSAADQAIINQYYYAFEKLRGSERCKLKVVKFTGRLYINCINILKIKCSLTTLPPSIPTFAELKTQGQLIIQMLGSNCIDLVKDIIDTVENFNNIRSMDDVLKKAEDRNIEESLILAHTRATATILEKLHATQRVLTESRDELYAELITARNDIANSVTWFERTRGDIWSVRQGVAAAARLMEDIDSRTSNNLKEN